MSCISWSLDPVLRIRIHKDPKLLPYRIQICILNKLISRIWIRIRNHYWGSGLLKDKCSDENTIFNIKSSISAQKLTLNLHSNFKCKNFTNISQTRIQIRIRKDPWAGSGSEMTLQVGSGSSSRSEINSFRSATLLGPHGGRWYIKKFYQALTET